MRRPEPSPLAAHWTLDPDITFLNHGAFGACPREVLALQSELRARMERDPIDFFVRAVEPLLDEARGRLAEFLHADADDLAFVDNATAGTNTVLRSLTFRPGDELLTTDHVYNACGNALRWAAERAGARVVVVPLGLPLRGPEQVVEGVLGAVSERTRLALLDHVTSATAVVFPIESLVPALQARGVDVLVDGAHAPGMVPVDLQALGAAYYTGNCHKWLCAPKGAAIPPRAQGPPGGHPPSGREPRRQLAADRPLALPPRVRLDRHARPIAVPLRASGRRARGGARPGWLARGARSQRRAGPPRPVSALRGAGRGPALSGVDARLAGGG